MLLSRSAKLRAFFCALCAFAFFAPTIALPLDAEGRDDHDELARGTVPSEVEMIKLLESAAESSPLFRSLMLSFFALIVLGIAVDVRFVWRRIRRRPGSPPRRLLVAWGLWDVAKVVLVFLAAIVVLRACYPIVQPHWAGVASRISAAVIFQFLAELTALFFLFQLLPRGGGGALRELKLAGGNVAGQIGAGIKSYIGLLPVLIALGWVTEAVAERVGIALEPQAQIGFFFIDISLPALIFLVIFVAVVGPIFEEIFFRGFAYQALRKNWGRWPSILLTALLFSALHASFSVFLPILGLGVLLAYVFETTGSLVPAITIHICQNSVAVAGALLLRSLS